MKGLEAFDGLMPRGSEPLRKSLRESSWPGQRSADPSACPAAVLPPSCRAARLPRAGDKGFQLKPTRRVEHVLLCQLKTRG